LPKFKAVVEVKLKPGYLDPEGETAKFSLRELGYDVEDVKVSKVYEIMLNADSKEDAKRLVEEMCVRLLSNPVKDNYSYKVEKA